MSFEVFYRDEGLPENSTRVHLRGLLGVAWPQFCVKCGAPTTKRMTVRKVFRRRAAGSDSVQDDKVEWHWSAWHYVIRSFRIPYCDACIARQESLREHVSTGRLLFRLVATPLTIAFAFATFFAFKLYTPLVPGTAGNAGHPVAIGIYALLVFTMVITAFSSWRAARFHLIPATTEITRACQMSDRLGWYDTGFHRIYAFANPSYAEAFATSNRDRVWTERDQARMRRRKMISMTVLFGSLAVGGIWIYVLRKK